MLEYKFLSYLILIFVHSSVWRVRS